MVRLLRFKKLSPLQRSFLVHRVLPVFGHLNPMTALARKLPRHMTSYLFHCSRDLWISPQLRLPAIPPDNRTVHMGNILRVELHLTRLALWKLRMPISSVWFGPRHSRSSAIVRFIKRFDGTAAGSRALRATSTPATGSPAASNSPNCTRADAWSQ